MHPPRAVPSPRVHRCSPMAAPRLGIKLAWPQWRGSGAEPCGGGLLPAPGSPGSPATSSKVPSFFSKWWQSVQPAGSSPAARSPPPPILPQQMPSDGNRRCSGMLRRCQQCQDSQHGCQALGWCTGPCHAPTPSQWAVRKKGCKEEGLWQDGSADGQVTARARVPGTPGRWGKGKRTASCGRRQGARSGRWQLISLLLCLSFPHLVLSLVRRRFH